MSSGATGICQYPLVKSIMDRYFLPLSCRNSSSAVVIDSRSTSVIVFNFLKSTHTPIRTILLLNHDAHCDIDGLTTPISSILSASFCSFSLHGTRQKVWLTSYQRIIGQLHSVLNHVSSSGHIYKHIRVLPDQVLQGMSLVLR